MPDLDSFCRTWLAAWTGNQPEKLRAFYAEDAFYADPVVPAGLRGPDILPYFRKLLARNPDWTWEPVEILPTARGFCVKWRARIRFRDAMVSVEGLDLVELDDGRISRNEVYFDMSVLLPVSARS